MNIFCEHCGQKYDIDKSYFGKIINCQSCKKSFIAPDYNYQKLISNCPVAGLYFYKKSVRKFIKNPSEISLVFEPQNKHDKNAIAIYCKYGKIGHLPREISAVIALMPVLNKILIASLRKIDTNKNGFTRIFISIMIKTELDIEAFIEEIKDIIDTEDHVRHCLAPKKKISCAGCLLIGLLILFCVSLFLGVLLKQ